MTTGDYRIKKNNMMKNNYRFFKNVDCRYYPCHEGIKELNCLFCYCPLYSFEDCGGNFYRSEKKIKVCTACIRPHKPENYDVIINLLKEKYNKKER